VTTVIQFSPFQVFTLIFDCQESVQTFFRNGNFFVEVFLVLGVVLFCFGFCSLARAVRFTSCEIFAFAAASPPPLPRPTIKVAAFQLQGYIFGEWNLHFFLSGRSGGTSLLFSIFNCRGFLWCVEEVCKHADLAAVECPSEDWTFSSMFLSHWEERECLGAEPRTSQFTC